MCSCDLFNMLCCVSCCLMVSHQRRKWPGGGQECEPVLGGVIRSWWRLRTVHWSTEARSVRMCFWIWAWMLGFSAERPGSPRGQQVCVYTAAASLLCLANVSITGWAVLFYLFIFLALGPDMFVNVCVNIRRVCGISGAESHSPGDTLRKVIMRA